MLEYVQYSVYLIWSIYMQCYCWYCFALFPIDIVTNLKNCGWLYRTKDKRERNEHFNIPESAFLVYLNVFVSAISLVEMRDLLTRFCDRKTNILFAWKCQKLVFLFVCLPCTPTFSVYFHSNIFIGAVKY